jgi:hypothetical protein
MKHMEKNYSQLKDYMVCTASKKNIGHIFWVLKF